MGLSEKFRRSKNLIKPYKYSTFVPVCQLKKESLSLVGLDIQIGNSIPDRRKMMEPEWLRLLITHTFFADCGIHRECMSRKTKQNMYCIDCSMCLCWACLSADPVHNGHRRLQIRRYGVQDCVKTDDVRCLIDIYGIQEYVSNGAKVLLLKAKQSKLNNAAVPHRCRVCHSFLNEANQYCSLACKVSAENNLDFSSPRYRACSMELLDGPEADSAVDNSSNLFERSGSSRPVDLVEESEGPRMSFRKRSRKGVPIRSPTH